MMAGKESDENTHLLSLYGDTPGSRTSRTLDLKGQDQGGPTDVRSSNDGNWMSRMHVAEYRSKFLRSVWLCCVMLNVGILLGQIGTAILDLQIITHTSIQQASFFLTVTPAGDIVGALVAGFIYDHLSKTLLPLVTLQILGLVFLAIPFCSVYWLMVTACFMAFFCRTALSLVSTVDTLRIWGPQGKSFTQAIRFALSFGGVISPLFTEPFLAPRNQTSMDHLSNHTTPRAHDHSYFLELAPSDFELDLTTDPIPPDPATAPNASTPIRFAFFISATVCFIVSLPLYVYYIRGCFGKLKQTSSNSEPELMNDVEHTKYPDRVYYTNAKTEDLDPATEEQGETRTTFSQCGEQRSSPVLVSSSSSSGVLNLPLVPQIAVGTWLVLFYLVDIGSQLMVWSYLTTFAVLQMNWTKSQGAFLTSAFWISMTFGRFVCIFLSRHLTNLQLLTFSIVLCIPPLVGFIMASLIQLDWGVWLCTLLCGLFLAPTYATSLAWTNSSLLPMTGKLNCLVDITIACGQMATLAVQGALIGNGGAMWFAYIMLGKTILSCFILFALYVYSHHYLLPKYGTK